MPLTDRDRDLRWRCRRIDLVKDAIALVQTLAGYECASVDQPPEDTRLCGKCGPCEARIFLVRWGLR